MTLYHYEFGPDQDEVQEQGCLEANTDQGAHSLLILDVRAALRERQTEGWAGKLYVWVDMYRESQPGDPPCADWLDEDRPPTTTVQRGLLLVDLAETPAEREQREAEEREDALTVAAEYGQPGVPL